jgi:DnaJ-class molecular chaperone
MPRDPYEVLGVKHDAAEDDIKKAYRSLARQYHPDRNPGDKEAERRFKEVQDAYDILSDKNKRAQYDQFGFAGPETGGGPGGFQFRWGGSGGAPGGFEGIDPEQAQELFSQFFGGGVPGFGDAGGRRSRSSRSRRPQPPEPVTTEVSIPFISAALGGTVSLRVNGHELDVKIPAGVEEGQTMRLAGQAPGGADLHLKLRIQPHPYFRREGNNILLEVPVSVAEAVLGGKVDVPTLDGTKLTVKVPPGTSSGARLRLRGKGIKGGDEFIELKVMVPPGVNDRGKELIEEFNKLHPHNPREGLSWS